MNTIQPRCLLPRLPGILFLLVILGALPACNDDDVAGPEQVIVLAQSRDCLMSLYLDAFATRNVEIYRQLLHPDFEFRTEGCPEVQDEPDFTFDRDQEIAWARLLFSSEPYETDHGVLPGASGVDPVFERLTTWQLDSASPGEDIFTCHFRLELSIHRPGSTTILYRGIQLFQAVSATAVVNGSELEYWQILAQHDTECTLANLKRVYR